VLEKEKGTPADQRLAQIGARWKLLSEDEKKVYQQKADAKNVNLTNAETASVATAP
jgi:hypothetical protein